MAEECLMAMGLLQDHKEEGYFLKFVQSTSTAHLSPNTPSFNRDLLRAYYAPVTALSNGE